MAAATDINVGDSSATPGRVFLFGLGVGPGTAPPGPPIGGLVNPPAGPSTPTVTSVSPGGGTAAGGTTVTIDGTGFSGADGVAFGGVAATTYTIESDSEITATTPAGSGTVDVQVGRGGTASATSTADQFVYSNGSGSSLLTVTGPSPTMHYGSPVPALIPAYQGFVNGDTASSLTTPATCTTTATSSSPPASYPVTCSGAVDPDYTITYTAGSVTVLPASLTVEDPTPTVHYGSPVPALTPAYQGFVNGDTASSLTTAPTCTTTATSSSPPASYPVTCSGAVDPDYTITYTAGSVTVGAAPLAVKAPKLAVTMGAVVPALIPAYQGFVNGDTASSLTTPATCTTTATSSSPPASYPVTCSGAVDPDYAITYTAGSVTVVALRSQTISFSPPTTATVGSSVTLSATGGASGEPVVFSIDQAGGAGVCTSTGPDGSDVTFDAPGARVVDADQAGTATFAAAEDQQVITVLPSGPTGPTGRGYWLVGSDGGVFADGNGFYGSGVALHLDRPVVGVAATPDGKGYWLVAADGGVFAFGDAGFLGSAVGLHLDRPVVGMAATPDGKGYWLVDADGGVFAFGDAGFLGSAVGLHLGRAVVGMAATSDGKGYWLVAADGGVFAFGDAGFDGSAVGLHLDRPVVDMAATPDGKGYWLVAADGGVFAFGDAPYSGSGATASLDHPVVGVAADPDGRGYWLSTADGGVLSFGDAPAVGNQAGLVLNGPVVSMAG